MKVVKVVDFCRFPGPRYKKLGANSGEAFRDDVLIPALESDGYVKVDLNGVYGYGSSFLEEAFGGLVRAGIDKEKCKWLSENLIADDKSLKIEVNQYINDALKVKAP